MAFTLTVTVLAGGQAVPVFAQDSRVSGTVTDSQGAVVAGAEVQLTDESTGGRRTTVTNESGAYLFGALRPGNYALAAKARNLSASAPTQVFVDSGAILRVDLQLRAVATEDVTVTGNVEFAGNRATSIGTSVQQRLFQNMPLNGRSFQPLLELAPGVVTTTGGFSVNGQRPDTNYFMVDGVSGNVGTSAAISFEGAASGQAPASTSTGNLSPLASVDAISQVRIETSSFAPEFGRTPGAMFSVVTRSGTNQVHGTFNAAFRDDSMDATPWFVNYTGRAKPPLSQRIVTGTIGGPIKRERIHYFATLEAFSLNQPRLLSVDVPTPALRATAPEGIRPLLNALPLPNGPDRGNGLAQYNSSTADPSRGHVPSVRIDYRPAGSVQIFGRYSGSRSRARQNSTSLQQTRELEYDSATFGATFAPFASTFFDVRANWTRNDATATAAPIFADGAVTSSSLFPPFDPETSSIAYNVGSSSLRQGAQIRNGQQQLNLIGTVTRLAGSHQIKGGFDIRRLSPELHPNAYEAVIVVSSVADMLAGRASTVLAREFAQMDGAFDNYSLYVQDTWAITRPLSATYGVRWDVNPAPSFDEGTGPFAATTNDLASLDLAPRGTRLFATDRSAVAPRVGLAYSFDPQSRAVLTAGAGLFFDLGSQFIGSVMNGGFYGNLSTVSRSNRPLPLTSSDLTSVPVAAAQPPYVGIVRLADPELQTPVTRQWNVRFEYQLTPAHSASVAYVGAEGDDLVVQRLTRAPNVRFPGNVSFYDNGGRSRFDSLQLQFRSRTNRWLDGIVSYTYAGARDDGSSFQAPSISGFSLDLWGPSDFDIRHNLTGGFSFDVPRLPGGLALLEHTGVDVFFRARSGVPFNVVTGRDTFAVGNTTLERPNVVEGVPIWIDDASVPGHRRLNRAAFEQPPTGIQGNHARNSLRGLASGQIDLSLRRRVTVRDLTFEFRANAFNIFNQASFSTPDRSLTSGSFGLTTSPLNAFPGTQESGNLSSLYQWGGSRSIELGFRVSF